MGQATQKSGIAETVSDGNWGAEQTNLTTHDSQTRCFPLQEEVCVGKMEEKFDFLQQLHRRPAQQFHLQLHLQPLSLKNLL